MEKKGTLVYNYDEILVHLLLSSLWGVPLDLSGHIWSHEQVCAILDLARAQTVEGLIIQGLMDSGVHLDRDDVRELFASRVSILQRNNELDLAVNSLYGKLADAGIRVKVIKGQTVAILYPYPKTRSSGDIDFYCHPEDLGKATSFIREQFNKNVTDKNSPKHAEFNSDGVKYEMHRMLHAFSLRKHQRYWDKIVDKDIWTEDVFVGINGMDIPILPPTVNAAYLFAHIFGHLISEGIGLRQFCDWALVLKHYKDEIDRDKLAEYLDGIGLKKAFVGFGAILTDYLGLPEEVFPFEIPAEFHKRAESLWKNILDLGNFGKNKKYLRKSGPIHGMQHLWRIAGQAIKFGHYAPAESWWKIPRMFMWWVEKMRRMIRKDGGVG